MTRPHALAVAFVASTLLAAGALALEGPPAPAAADLARVVEFELRWLAAQPTFARHRHSVAELAAVREALRRALVFARPDHEVVDRVLRAQALDLDETPVELGARLAARARALGPFGEDRWGAVVAAAAAVFDPVATEVAGSMAAQLHRSRRAPPLPAGFDFTRPPAPVDPETGRVSAALRDLPAPPRTGDPAMDALAAEVLASLAEDVTSQAAAPSGPTFRAGDAR